jgi:hypothetical protein
MLMMSACHPCPTFSIVGAFDGRGLVRSLEAPCAAEPRHPLLCSAAIRWQSAPEPRKESSVCAVWAKSSQD